MSNSKKVIKHTCVGCREVKPDAYGSWMGKHCHFWICFSCQKDDHNLKKLDHVDMDGNLTLICDECGGFYIKCLIWGHIKGV